MARYLAKCLMRWENGAAIVPGLPFERVYQPEHEAALLEAGAIERLDSPDVIDAERIAAGLVEPEPEPELEPESPAVVDTNVSAVADEAEE